VPCVVSDLSWVLRGVKTDTTVAVLAGRRAMFLDLDLKTTGARRQWLMPGHARRVCVCVLRCGAGVQHDRRAEKTLGCRLWIRTRSGSSGWFLPWMG